MSSKIIVNGNSIKFYISPTDLENISKNFSKNSNYIKEFKYEGEILYGLSLNEDYLIDFIWKPEYNEDKECTNF